jgi:hypothetical protein
MPITRKTESPWRESRRIVVTMVKEAHENRRLPTLKWAYDVHALCSITGLTERQVWHNIEQRHFNPASLESVLKWMRLLPAAKLTGAVETKTHPEPKPKQNP